MNTKKIKFWMKILFYFIIAITYIYGFLYFVDLNGKNLREKYPERYSGAQQKHIENEESDNTLLKAAAIYYFISQ